MNKSNQSRVANGLGHHVALYCKHLQGGGAEQKVLRLCRIFLQAGYKVDLLINKSGGRYTDQVPDGIRLILLSSEPEKSYRQELACVLRSRPVMRVRARFISPNRLDWLRYVPALRRYLEENRPDLLISNLWSLALVAVSARNQARCTTKLVCIFRSAFFSEAVQRGSMRRHPIRWHQFFHLCRNLYAEADALVTVSQGVATDLIEIVGLRQDTVRVLPNPVIEPELPGKAAVSLEHSWLAGNTSPVLLAVGRLSPEKNYPMLMRTVALLKRRMTVRLVIIGEGQERVRLEDMRDKLGLTDDVLLPGWDDNPYRWMSRASVVVMCSDWEGLPTVLIEAMACGTPVVSTDCPHGPREILENGRYGELVPVDNEELLACAIERTIQAPVDKKTLVQSAQRYSVEASRSAFLDLANELIATV